MSVRSDRIFFFVTTVYWAPALQEVTSIGKIIQITGASLDSVLNASWLHAEEITYRLELQNIFKKTTMPSQHSEI